MERGIRSTGGGRGRGDKEGVKVLSHHLFLHVLNTVCYCLPVVGHSTTDPHTDGSLHPHVDGGGMV